MTITQQWQIRNKLIKKMETQRLKAIKSGDKKVQSDIEFLLMHLR